MLIDAIRKIQLNNKFKKLQRLNMNILFNNLAKIHKS